LDFKKVDEIIARHRGKAEEKIPPLIPILQDIQDEYGWLPEQAFVKTSRQLDIPLVNLYGVATFYNEFRLKPIGNYHISVCMGTACHVQGAPRILSELERKLEIADGEITPDEKYSLETSSCFGCCAIAPAIMVNGEYHGKMDKKKVDELLENIEQEKEDEKVKQNG